MIEPCIECGSGEVGTEHYDTIGPSLHVMCYSCKFRGPYNNISDQKEAEVKAIQDWNKLTTKLYKALR